MFVFTFRPSFRQSLRKPSAGLPQAFRQFSGQKYNIFRQLFRHSFPKLPPTFRQRPFSQQFCPPTSCFAVQGLIETTKYKRRRKKGKQQRTKRYESAHFVCIFALFPQSCNSAGLYILLFVSCFFCIWLPQRIVVLNGGQNCWFSPSARSSANPFVNLPPTSRQFPGQKN